MDLFSGAMPSNVNTHYFLTDTDTDTDSSGRRLYILNLISIVLKKNCSIKEIMALTILSCVFLLPPFKWKSMLLGCKEKLERELFIMLTDLPITCVSGVMPSNKSN